MNTESIMQSFAPVYVTATNMIVPLASISLTSIKSNVVEFSRIVVDYFAIMQSIVSIWLSTIFFIMKQSFVEISNVMSDIDKIFLVFSIYNVVMFAYENYKLNAQVKNLKADVEQLEKNVAYFKKTERMREDWEQMWAEEVREYYNEHNNKYKELNKELKKLRKDMNQYA